MQISEELGQPAIIIQAWPPEQQLAGALQGVDGYNETIQYIQAMPSLFTEVHPPHLHCTQPRPLCSLLPYKRPFAELQELHGLNCMQLSCTLVRCSLRGKVGSRETIGSSDTGSMFVWQSLCMHGKTAWLTLC